MTSTSLARAHRLPYILNQWTSSCGGDSSQMLSLLRCFYTSPREFAYGFFQTQPRGYALALG